MAEQQQSPRPTKTEAQGTATDELILSSPDVEGLVERVGGAFVVEVRLTGPARAAGLPGGADEPPVAARRYRRRVFLTLAAAEKAVRNAQARGVNAHVVLCELRPVYLVRARDDHDRADGVR